MKTLRYCRELLSYMYRYRGLFHTSSVQVLRPCGGQWVLQTRSSH